MKRRERLMATLRGEPVDRPPVCFYEINGYDENTSNADPLNIYSHPSWAPLIRLAREKSDRIVIRGVPFKNAPPDPLAELRKSETHYEQGSLIGSTTIRAGRRTFTTRWRRDPDVNTVWTLEHLLKDADDLRAWLELPMAEFGGEPETSGVLKAEEGLGDTGIVSIDVGDPILGVAPMFDMGEFTVVALTEQKLFHAALERCASVLYLQIEAIARALPGRLWRIVGPEYASPPYLPPRLFREYVANYDKPIVEAIAKHGGFPRIHCHGRLHDILDDIASTGCTGLDPIEPPPQGDVDMLYVRQKYGKQMVLFGNLEASDLENLPAAEFEKKIVRAVREGTAGEGRGMVLMPSACPYGRVLSPRALGNYEKMVEVIERGAG